MTTPEKMNQLEVGKVYKCINNVEWKCISIREERPDSDQAVMESIDGKVVILCSIYGTKHGGREFIEWPVMFKPGQLVMVRCYTGVAWSRGFFKRMNLNAFCCETVGGVMNWEQCRLPTEAEWLEFREGKN
jgi:hypothetical protein